jgi:hypothetical protein
MQYVEESTYGTTPTSASFIDASVINSTRTTYKNINEIYRKLGSRKLYKNILMGNARTFSTSYSPVDTTLARYGTENGNATGTATGTIDKGLTFVNSMYRNSAGTLTEYYVVRKGCKVDSITISTSSRGMVVIDMDWICSTITLTSSANGGLTTPTFVSSPTTSTPWTNLTGGTSKLSIGGTVYPFKNASVTVNNNLDAVDVDGDANIQALEPTVKESTFSCELIVQKDTALETSNLEAGASQALILTLNSTGPKTITGNLFLDTKEEEDASDETKVQTVKFSGLLDDVTLTA